MTERPRRDLQGEIRAALTSASIQSSVPAATGLVAARRREAVAGFPAYERARDRARAIKESAIERLPELIEIADRAVRAAGGHVHHAADAQAARDIIASIARQYGCERAVKSKSMTSEEIHLNEALAAAGVAVRETDLGEYIVQLDGDRPSHLVAPILHKSLEDVRETFRRELGTQDVPATPEGMTQIARERLRQDFLAADLGITGANFVVAETGTVVVVENEGNARLCTQLPPVHVALAGVEKLIPGIDDLQPFLELLPRSATGQLLSAYLSLITGPGWGASPLVERERAFHLVLLDNGRMTMRSDPVLREALYCIRCGACMNVCAPYQAVGGHVFGGPTYQSGIGVAWEAGVRGLETAAEFADLCSTCSRCEDVCPIRIHIPWMNSALKGRLQEGGKRRSRGLGTALLEPRRLYERIRATPGAHWLAELPPVRWYLERSLAIDRRRQLPRLPQETLSQWHAARGGAVLRDGSADAARVDADRTTAVFWADCHTEHAEVSAGQAAVRVLERLGHTVVVATGPCCGRAALSQGDMEAASSQAVDLVGFLDPLVESAGPIVGLEPSCVSCVTGDFERLLPESAGGLRVAVAVTDLFEFLDRHRDRLAALAGEATTDRNVIVHGHCQQKTAGWFPAAMSVLGALPGVTATSTAAECCGMAGSYGYKTATYEVSGELGSRLAGEIAGLEGSIPGSVEVLACGTSCRTQIADFGEGKPRHPIEFVDEATR